MLGLDQSDLQVFLSIKILTIRFDLFPPAPQALVEWLKHARLVFFFFLMPRKETITPPPQRPCLPCLPWKPGQRYSPTSSSRARAFRRLLAASEAAPGVFLGSWWVRVSKLDPATYQSNPGGSLFPSAPSF